MPKDKRTWYIIIAVIAVVVLSYSGGFFGGSEPEPVSEEQTTN